MSTITTSPASLDDAKRTDAREKISNGSAAGILNGIHAVAKRNSVLDHPLAQHALTALRNKDTAGEEFRFYCSQLLVLLVAEASRSLTLREEKIDVHGETIGGKVLAKNLVLLAVTRDGLGLAHGLAKTFAGIQVGSISLHSPGEGRRPEPRMHLFNAPVLSDARVILFDPIVATGLSATMALSLMRRSGATDVWLVTFLSSAQGLERIHAAYPEAPVWTGAVDSDWDAKRGPLPGIWNFSERMFS